MLLVWVRMARGMVRLIRAHPIATGVVDALEPHPTVGTVLAVGRAARPDGGQVNVQAELPLAREIERAGTPAEVWFIDHPAWEDYRAIFAARPLGPRPEVDDAAEHGAAADRAGGRRFPGV